MQCLANATDDQIESKDPPNQIFLRKQKFTFCARCFSYCPAPLTLSPNLLYFAKQNSSSKFFLNFSTTRQLQMVSLSFPVLQQKVSAVDEFC